MKVGTIDATPAPGALFDEALAQFEDAAHARWVSRVERRDMERAQRHYEEKRQALLDYVQALETKEK